MIDRLFVRRYGLTPKSYHTRVRLRRSISLLRSSDIKVEALARRIGYLSPSSFYEALAKHALITPMDIRLATPAQIHELLVVRLDINTANLHDCRIR